MAQVTARKPRVNAAVAALTFLLIVAVAVVFLVMRQQAKTQQSLDNASDSSSVKLTPDKKVTDRIKDYAKLPKPAQVAIYVDAKNSLQACTKSFAYSVEQVVRQDYVKTATSCDNGANTYAVFGIRANSWAKLWTGKDTAKCDIVNASKISKDIFATCVSDSGAISENTNK